MKTYKLPAIIATALVVGHSHGAVVLQDFYSALDPVGPAPSDFGGGVFGYEINFNPLTEFSAAGHGKLVLVYTSHDGAAGGTAPPNITRITYGGVALTQAVYAIDNSPLVSAGIFYLDNVASDGTLRIELDANNIAHYGIGLYAVDGLKPGVQGTGSARTNTEFSDGDATITITTSEGFFVQEAARNNQSFVDTLDEYNELYNFSADSYRGYSQYRVTDAAGDYLAPIGNGGENFRRVVTAGFEAADTTVIPEPSTLLLGGMGLLALLRRRRD